MKCEKLTSENRREFISMIRWASKIAHEWNGHLEIFSQVKAENSGQNLLLLTVILQKIVVGCPWPELWKRTIGLIAAQFLVHFLAVELHDYNVKRPETSWFSLFMQECGTSSCSRFPLPFIFFTSGINSYLFGDSRAIGSFWKLQGLSLSFSRLIDPDAMVPSLP